MRLLQIWQSRGPAAWALRPLSWMYGAIGAIRRAIYRAGLLRVQRVGVPVVVVGNVLAGGAGKTPVVVAVVEHLKAQGLRPGVISRGHGRTSRGCLEVRPDTAATQAGDEPLLVARRCAVPVAVAERRADAARLLLQQHPQIQVLVSDDGLQHLALARDLEVCVFDERGTGNGWLLPAGPLRERWPRRVDLVLRPPGAGPVDGFSIERALGPEAMRADGSRRALADFAGERLMALAGIARPEAFFAMLRRARLAPERTLALADHHDFSARPVRCPEGMVLLCTEKDAVKLWPQAPGAWAVPLQVRIEPAFWQAFDRLLSAKLSSPDGPQTA